MYQSPLLLLALFRETHPDIGSDRWGTVQVKRELAKYQPEQPGDAQREDAKKPYAEKQQQRGPKPGMQEMAKPGAFRF